MQARKQRSEILTVWKENNHQLSNLYLVRVSFKSGEEIKTKFKETCHQEIPKRNVKSSTERRKITGQKLNIHQERNGVGEGKK